MGRSAKAAAKRGSTEGRRTRARQEHQIKELRRQLQSKLEAQLKYEDAIKKEATAVQGWMTYQRESEDFIREIDLEKAKIKKQVCESLELFPRRLVCPLMRRAVGFNERIVSSRSRVFEMIQDTQDKIKVAERRMQTFRQRLTTIKRRITLLKHHGNGPIDPLVLAGNLLNDSFGYAQPPLVDCCILFSSRVFGSATVFNNLSMCLRAPWTNLNAEAPSDSLESLC
ncbi:hypothetical protein IWZ03DRAFT_433328 [Phyllosticta citriasiana]|uniref:Uncharacterized protein n=1 Tax=Phyllosticta citriasiana TaxID=595635 RepID=A0ABR1K968_9PEZI